MITAHTTARIEVAASLSIAKRNILDMRSHVCLNDKEVEKIDNIVLDIDAIVNRVMGVIR
jgi:hypothetical protein